MHEKVEIRLHNRSVIRLSRTQMGAVYLEHLRPMDLKDGHGLAVSGSSFLSEHEQRMLARLLAPKPGTAGTRAPGDGKRPECKLLHAPQEKKAQ